MIETDATGNKQIKDLAKSLNECEWNEWETDFIESLSQKDYKYLSPKQKTIVSNLHEKMKDM